MLALNVIILFIFRPLDAPCIRVSVRFGASVFSALCLRAYPIFGPLAFALLSSHSIFQTNLPEWLLRGYGVRNRRSIILYMSRMSPNTLSKRPIYTMQIGNFFARKISARRTYHYLEQCDQAADDNVSIPYPKTSGSPVSYFKKKLLKDTSPSLTEPDYERVWTGRCHCRSPVPSVQRHMQRAGTHTCIYACINMFWRCLLLFFARL